MLVQLKTNTGQIFSIESQGSFTIGAQNAKILLTGRGIADQHATLIYVNGQTMITPIHDVRVNGHPITKTTRITSNDTFQIGDTLLVIEILNTPAQQTTQTTQTNSSHFSLQKTPPSFELNESFFTEAIDRSVKTPSEPAPSHEIKDDHTINTQSLTAFKDILTPVTKTTPQLPSSPPSSPPPTAHIQVIDEQNLSEQECRHILRTFFHDSQIYKKQGDGIQLNFSERWRKSETAVGKTWVLMTEGIKLGLKANEWLSNQSQKVQRPADYVDEAIKDAVRRCIEVAYDRLAMRPTLTQDPLVIYGPIFWRENTIPLEHICARKGDDGFVRFSAQQVSILVLDDDQLGVYICVLDTITGVITSHKTRSYNYKDIVSIADEDTSIEVEMEDGTQKINVYAFNIEVSSGRNLSITLNSQRIRDLFNGEAVEQPEHEQTVNVIRQMWRSKKNQ